MPSSRGSSQPRDWNWVSDISCIGRQFLSTRPTWEAHETYSNKIMLVFRARADREAGSGRVLFLGLPSLDSRLWTRTCSWLTPKLWGCSTTRPVQNGGQWVQEAEDPACWWVPWQWRGCCLRQRSRGGGWGDSWRWGWYPRPCQGAGGGGERVALSSF